MMARIFRQLAKEASKDEEAVRAAWKHTEEVCAATDRDKRGFEGLPPEPGSWGVRREDGK